MKKDTNQRKRGALNKKSVCHISRKDQKPRILRKVSKSTEPLKKSVSQNLSSKTTVSLSHEGFPKIIWKEVFDNLKRKNLSEKTIEPIKDCKICNILKEEEYTSTVDYEVALLKDNFSKSKNKAQFQSICSGTVLSALLKEMNEELDESNQLLEDKLKMGTYKEWRRKPPQKVCKCKLRECSCHLDKYKAFVLPPEIVPVMKKFKTHYAIHKL